MKKVNPLLIINLILLMFIIAGFTLIYFFINLNVGFIGIICVSIVTIFLVFLTYSLNFGIPASDKTNEKIENTKKSLTFSKTEIIVINPILEKKTLINWESIEAIFLLNKPPLDGEYHNFEYTIILNSEPKEIKFETQKWFNKTTIFPKLKKKGLPIIRINDDSNRDFHTFYEAANKYLPNVNKDTQNYLNLKFGNEFKYSKLKNSLNSFIIKPMKTTGFYKIFDQNNNFNDEILNTFREETTNNKS